MRILVTFLLVFVSAMSFGQSFDWLNSIGDEGFENVTALGVGPDSTYVISGTIRSDEAQDLPLVHFEGHAIDGGKAAEALNKPFDGEYRFGHGDYPLLVRRVVMADRLLV